MLEYNVDSGLPLPGTDWGHALALLVSLVFPGLFIIYILAGLVADSAGNRVARKKFKADELCKEPNEKVALIGNAMISFAGSDWLDVDDDDHVWDSQF